MRVRRRDARSSGCIDNPGSVWIFLFACLAPCSLLVFKLCPDGSLSVCRFPAAALHVDDSAHVSIDHIPYFRFRLESKDVWHSSDHVVCRVDVSSVCFDILTLKTTPP